MTIRIIVENYDAAEQLVDSTVDIVRPHLALAFGENAIVDGGRPDAWHTQIEGEDMEFEVDARAGGAPKLAWIMGGDLLSELPLPAEPEAIKSFLDDALWTMSDEHMDAVMDGDPAGTHRPEGWTGSMLGRA